MLLYWIVGIGIVFHCQHNSKIHSYIQSLNPILKILKFKYRTSNTAQSLFKPFPRNQLTTKAQSCPRKSSNTASPMIARHAKDFTWNWGCSSNSPPLKHGDQIPHPLEDSDNQIPSSRGRQKCQMPGGGGMLKLRFDRYINTNMSCLLYKKGIICIYGSFHKSTFFFSSKNSMVLTSKSVTKKIKGKKWSSKREKEK